MTELNTLVVGASLKPERYSNMAIKMLRENDFPTYAFGLREGRVSDVDIMTSLEGLPEIDTITLYLNPKRQEAIIEDLLALNPKRIVFNPGTESEKSKSLAEAKGIYVQYACTLVLLRTEQYASY
ncbi:MAG TPA: CoA-binding protein [Chitinophagaceae bacterium]|nr:CoA-binding protein [Chitinophagaceae bacterium]